MKAIVIVLGVGFVILQAYWTFAPDIGIVSMYGFFEAFPAYFSLHSGNGLLLAGLTDFMFMCVLNLLLMFRHLPARRRKAWPIALWLISFVVFPGLGLLVYCLYLNPGILGATKEA